MPLTRRQSRAFVAGFVALMLGLAVLATVLITRGWANEGVQEQVKQKEAERRAQMPRLNPDARPGDSAP